MKTFSNKKDKKCHNCGKKTPCNCSNCGCSKQTNEDTGVAHETEWRGGLVKKEIPDSFHKIPPKKFTPKKSKSLINKFKSILKLRKKELKSFLEFLNYMPDKIINIGLRAITICNKDIISDKLIESKLRKI